MKKLLLVAGLLMVPAGAFAQSSASPNNTSGPNIDPTVQAPTDMGISSESGDRRGIPSRLGTTGSRVIEAPASAPYAAPAPVVTEPPAAVIVHPSSGD